MRPAILSQSSSLRWLLLTIVSLSVGCRSAEFLASTSLSTAPKLPAIAPVREAKHHRRELHFLDALKDLSSDPEFAEIVPKLKEAEAARHRSDPGCLSLYAEVALACWPMLPSTETAGENPQVMLADHHASLSTDSHAVQHPSWLIYHHCVACLLEESQRFGHLDPQRGIRVLDRESNPAFIAVTRNGFPWKPEDFSELHVVNVPLQSHLKRYWSDPGLGVPLVALRLREQSTPHMSNVVPYSATAVLRPANEAFTIEPSNSNPSTTNAAAAVLQTSALEDTPTLAVLELHDPLRVTKVSDAERDWDLTRDISAPLGFAQSHLNRDNLKSFLNPGRDDKFAGLRMLEPYQPGKIPIVFVHGLLSDRMTWIDLINDLRHSPWISQHYQFWLYQYPTGTPFILSAADMRRTLQKTVEELDPQGTDPAMSEMVLIGHSMGGLVSKLMITTSGTDLWNSIASAPPDQVKIATDKRPHIDSIFFFEPLPFVNRVVFIGSPHQGSQIATGWIGKLGSALVHRSRDRLEETKTILHDNPGVFKDLERHLPTSIDLLRPDNPILQAVYALPVAPHIQMHTIIGTGHPLRDGTPADGVVPIASARHPGTSSEQLIESSHTQLPDHPQTTREVTRILSEHLQR